MHVLILLRVLAGIWVLHGSAKRLRFEHDPCAIAFLEIVSHLHSGSRRSACFGTELHFRMRLISVNRNAANVHVHSSHVEGAHAGKVLHDRRSDSVAIAWPFLTCRNSKESSNEPHNEGKPFHAQFSSIDSTDDSHEWLTLTRLRPDHAQFIAEAQSDANV